MNVDLKKFGELGEAIKTAIDTECDNREAKFLLRLGKESEEAKKIKETLEIINAKEFLTADEVAYLFNCGSDKIYKLVKEAKEGSTGNPIPFTPFGDTGMVRFERSKLLAWSRGEMKLRLQEVKRKAS